MKTQAAHPRVRKSLSVAIAVSSSMLLQSALAQDGVLEEVLVTAQKRTASLQDVPISVNAMAGQKMLDAGIKDLADMTAYVPNFQKSDTSIGQYLVIRGIGSGINQGFEQSVVQYVDDIALGRSMLARMPFLDLERVEVLRGPQNVLFGKNSIGGALSVITAKPSDEFEGRAGVEYEPEYNGKEGTFVVSGPLSDTFSGRLAVRYYEEDGFFDNNLNGNEEAGREETAIRGIIAWDVTDNVEASLKLEHDTFDFDGRTDEMLYTYRNPVQGDAFFGKTYPEIAATLSALTGQDIGSDDGRQNYKRNTNIDEKSKNDVDNATLRINWDLDWATMTSVTGYVGYELDEHSDTDGAGIDAFTTTQDEEYDQFSQEIRFVSPGGETVDWIAGAYYQKWDLDFRSDFLVDDENLWSALGTLGAAINRPDLRALSELTNLRNTREYDGDSETWAVFGQATWNVNDSLRLTLGARYTQEDKTARRVMNIYDTTTGELNLLQAIVGSTVFGVDFKNLGEATGGLFPIHDLKGDHGEDSFTPTGIVEYDLTADTLVYTSVSKGFKAGGFDARGNKAKDFDYDDESVISYELGIKTGLLDGAAELNAAVFYTDYEDLQVSQFDGTLGFVVGNAAQATTQGVEVDGRWLITDRLTLSGSLGYLDFEFDDYDDAACPAIQTVTTGQKLCDFSGRSNIFTPEWSASMSFDYVMRLNDTLDLRTTVDFNYRDDQFVDVTLNPDIKQDDYMKINARVALEAEAWTVALVGKNLTDEDITTFITDTPLSGTLKAPAYTGYMERPRTIAIQASYHF